jgi:hypothetical protein
MVNRVRRPALCRPWPLVIVVAFVACTTASAPSSHPATPRRAEVSAAEIEARIIRGARAHSSDELARRFMAALQSGDQDEMNRLFVIDRWFDGVCPWAGTGPDPLVNHPLNGANLVAIPVGGAVLRELGPCEIERVVVPGTVGPVSHTQIAVGRVCESEYQEARDLTVLLRCREDHSICLNLNDVAVVRGVWAVRDKAQWGVCRGGPGQPGFERLCDRDGDLTLCRRIQATLTEPFARALTR